MDEPTISIVIPTAGRHRRPMLAGCLAALVAQLDDVPGAEVVVVLDGDDPADGRPEVPAGVRVLARPKGGPAAARNHGWRATSAPVVAFLDDDTVPRPGWLRALADAFAAHPELAGIGGEVVPLRPHNLVSRTLTDHGHLAHRRGADGNWRLITANAAFRRNALDAVGGFDERFPHASGEDLDLCERLVTAGLRTGVAPGAVVAHHHPTTLRAMLAMARRYRVPIAGEPPVTGRAAGRFTVLVDRGAYLARNLRNVPAWYCVGRRSPHHPAPLVAFGEALVHLVWHAEYSRSGSAGAR
jgi:GT2 family glycosyltransferase